jgi:hypothetical protein
MNLGRNRGRNSAGSGPTPYLPGCDRHNHQAMSCAGVVIVIYLTQLVAVENTLFSLYRSAEQVSR